MSRVLIVDDEPSICWAFRDFLGELGHEVELAPSAEEGLRIAGGTALDAVVLDVRLPGMDGLTALGRFRELVNPSPIVVITAFGDLETAVRAMEGGAFEYLVKPFDLDEAAAVINRALETNSTSRAISTEGQPVRDLVRRRKPAGSVLIGKSAAMQQLFKQIALVAPTDAPVLITGESGTGKEIVARAIHRHSRRRDAPFVPVCLAALSPGLIEGELFGHVRGSFTGATHDRKGLLELAGGGSVLLDEVGDIPLSVQVKLLRAIEQQEVTPVGDARPRPIDVRFLAATNRPLDGLMATGQFREDLFFRLSVFPIQVPPLRERLEDIPALAAYFLADFGDSASPPVEVREDVARELISRSWTGNVRELRNAIERAAIIARGHEVRPEHLPPPSVGMTNQTAGADDDLVRQISYWASGELARAGASQVGRDQVLSLYDRLLAIVEPPLLRAVLHGNNGNRALAAQRLGIHRATLRQKLRKYGLG